jgi:ribose transport system substrate-binding protein
MKPEPEAKPEGELHMWNQLTRRTIIGAMGGATLALSALSARAQQPTFALVQINQQALFFTQMNEGAQKAAEKASAKLVIFNANNDPAAQNNAIETYIQQKMNGLVVVAIDVNGIMPAVKAAAAAGIPVVAVDAILPEGPQKAQVGVDNAAAGKMIAEHFAKYVDAEMGGTAKLGIVGALNSFIQNVRQKGFEDTIKGNSKITVAGVVDGRNIQDNALAAAENLMTGNPDLNAIYATGEPALLGAVAAVESQGRKDKVKIVGWDLTAQAIKGIDQGFVVGVVQQDPAGMGAAAVDALSKITKGQTVDKNIAVPVTIVTKANVDPYRAVFK